MKNDKNRPPGRPACGRHPRGYEVSASESPLCPIEFQMGRVPTGAASSTPVQTSVMSLMRSLRTVMKVATSKWCSCPSLSAVT